MQGIQRCLQHVGFKKHGHMIHRSTKGFYHHARGKRVVISWPSGTVPFVIISFSAALLQEAYLSPVALAGWAFTVLK